MWETIGKISAVLMGAFLGGFVGGWFGSLGDGKPRVARKVERKVLGAVGESAVYVPQLTPEERKVEDEPHERKEFFGGFAKPPDEQP